MVVMTSTSAAWMPSSLLPTRVRTAGLPPAPPLATYAAWRIHVRDISAEHLPSPGALGKDTPWAGLLLKFTAPWSQETKRVSLANDSGSWAWPGEHLTLTLPNSDAESSQSDHSSIPPEAAMLVELCCRMPGAGDEVLGAARVPCTARSANVRRLRFGGQALEALNRAASPPTASFTVDAVGLTREQAEYQWGDGDSTLAESRMMRERGHVLLGKHEEIAASAPARAFLPGGSCGLKGGGAGSLAAAPNSAPDLHRAVHGTPRGGGAADAPGTVQGAEGAHSVLSASGDAGSRGGPVGGGDGSRGALLAQPTTQLAFEQLQELGVDPLPPPPRISSSGASSDSRAASNKPRAMQTRLAPPKATPFAFGSSVPRHTNAEGIKRATSVGQLTGAAPKTAHATPSPAAADPTAPSRMVASASMPAGDTWLRPQTEPSERLLLQLEECARIKACFAKHGLVCPAAAIERGLLIPEDRPEVLCRLQLPRPSHMRPLSPRAAAEMRARIAAAKKRGKKGSKSPRKGRKKK